MELTSYSGACKAFIHIDVLSAGYYRNDRGPAFAQLALRADHNSNSMCVCVMWVVVHIRQRCHVYSCLKLLHKCIFKRVSS